MVDVLLIADDPSALAPAIERGGHRIARGDATPSIVVVDLARTEAAIAVLEQLRRDGCEAPALVLLPCGVALRDRVTALDRGADDVLAHPFDTGELLARMRALLRRAQPLRSAVLQIADLSLDTIDKRAERGGRTIPLSAHEYAVMECLFRHRRRPVTEQALATWVYDGGDIPASNTIAVFIRTLRRKIDGGQPLQLIHTVRGLGYVLSDEP